MTSLVRRALPVSLAFLLSIFQIYVVVDIYSIPNCIIITYGHENDEERTDLVIFIDSRYNIDNCAIPGPDVFSQVPSSFLLLIRFSITQHLKSKFWHHV